MSLADKLNYLKATKGLIKTAINNKGGTLTDDSSFRSYAEAIDDIGSNLTAEPEDILAGKTALSNDGLITGTSNSNATIGTTYNVYSNSDIGYLPPILKNIEKVDMTGFDAQTVSFDYFLAGCFSLETITNFPTFPDTLNITSAKYMFFCCAKLTTIPQLTCTSNIRTANNMFQGCSSLTTIPLFDTSAVTNMSKFFRGCNSLVTIPLFNVSSATDMSQMFYMCDSLTTLPTLNTASVTNLKEFCYSCSSLTTVPILDTSQITSTVGVQDMFKNCNALSEDSLNNILALCTNSGITAGGNRTLKYIGLTSAQATTCMNLSNYSAFINAGWTRGY